MTTAHMTEQLFQHMKMPAKGWRPGAWTVALLLTWLILLSVPTIWLFNIDGQDPGPTTPDAALKSWMPIYPSIV
jgi:hypothetical protein